MSWHDSGAPRPGFLSGINSYPGTTPYPPHEAIYLSSTSNPGLAYSLGTIPTNSVGLNPVENQPSSNMNNQYYGEAPSTGGVAFSDKSIRLGFIRKVYSILMIQLLITSCIIYLFIASNETQQYFADRPVWAIIAFVTTFICMIVMACCESVRRTPPTNYIFLLIFTVAEGFLLGVISAAFSLKEVLLAVGICTLLCFALTIFAFQTKVDFTAMGGILLIGSIILLIFGCVLMFFPGAIQPIRLIYACFGAFLFSIYLIYDTQLMAGGNHKYSISPEEYVFASLNIYLDIVNIFLFLLQIISNSRD